MAGETLALLQNLVPGGEARLYADAGTLQFTKTALYIVAAAGLLFAVKLFFGQITKLGGGQSLLGWLGVAAVAAVSFLVFDKAQSYAVLDLTEPVLLLNAKTLDYDTRRIGWSVPWAGIAEVQLHREEFQKKQSVKETTLEVRIAVRPEAQVTWKYEPNEKNDVAYTRKLLDEKRYMVIDHALLSVDAEALQQALEKYRAGL